MIKKLTKRITATAALALLVVYLGLFSVSSAIGTVQFVDMDTQNSANTTIVEGSTVNVLVTLPANYSPTDPPFIGSQGVAQLPDKRIITYTSAGAQGSNRYLLLADAGSAMGAVGGVFVAGPTDPRVSGSRPQYDIYAQFAAPLTQGDVREALPSGSVYSTTVKSDGTIGITLHSTIVLEVTRDEKIQGDVQFTIKDATGNFERFKTGADISLVGTTLTTSRTMTVRISKSGVNPVQFTFTTAQAFDKTPVDPQNSTEVVGGIKSGTNFTVVFAPPFVDPLLLTVLTPQQAVNDVAAAITANPTSANVTDSTKKPFVALATGDSLSGITTKSFSLLKAIQRYNIPTKDLDTAINIGWTFVPLDGNGDEITDTKDPKYKVVTIAGGTSNTYNAAVSPLVEDVDGYLKFDVFYKVPYSFTASDGTRVQYVRSSDTIYGNLGENKIRITITGTGIPSEMRDFTQTIGQIYSISDTVPPIPKTTTVNSFPKFLDVYQGARFAYPFAPLHPFKGEALITFGEKNSAADYAVIKSTDGKIAVDAVGLYIGGNGTPYKLGTQIVNSDKIGSGSFKLEIVAAKTGSVGLVVEFYLKGTLMGTKHYINTSVLDSTPSSDSRLKNFEIVPVSLPDEYKGYEIKTTLLANGTVAINIPNKARNIKISPFVNDPKADRMVDVDYSQNRLSIDNFKVQSGTFSGTIALDEDKENRLELTVTAEDRSQSKYFLIITVDPPSNDAKLKKIGVFETDEDTAVNLITGFIPTVTTYNVSVKNKVSRVVLSYDKNWFGTFVAIEQVPKPPFSFFSLFGQKEWIELVYDESDPMIIKDTTTVTLTSTAENGADVLIYTVNIKRLPPSENANVKSIAFSDKSGKVMPFDDGQKFNIADRDYYLTIPYSTSVIKLAVIPEDTYASRINATYPNKFNDPYTVSENIVLGIPVPLLTLDLDISGITNPFTSVTTDNDFDLEVFVNAEKNIIRTRPPYIVHITRAPPDDNVDLASMTVTDIANKAISTFSFNTAVVDYKDLNVDYLTDSVIISPKSASPLSTVAINNQRLTATKTSVTVKLPIGAQTVVTVTVVAESEDTQDYLLHLKRNSPAGEARLADLGVGGILKLEPKFIPSTTSYSGVVVKSAKAVTVVAKPISQYATMRINGNTAVSGVSTQPIDILFETQTVNVEVTAQDGKTKIIYALVIQNPNLLPSSNNVDLKSLLVDGGTMNPGYIASIDTYDVATLPDISYIKINAVPVDPYATLEIKQGTKLIESKSGNYSAAIKDGENKFTVKVTASDESKTKEYILNVYRNEEGKMGALTPIKAQKLNFNQNPIVVDISNYAVVDADVFVELAKYPQTTVIFNGNDYSFQFIGKDINTTVPFAKYYDLSLNYSSPDAAAIDKNLAANGNVFEGGYPVFVYFNQHTDLPATGIFTLSLGTAYANRRLYWNYYNIGRDRIDYYGYFKTNSRGTFTVPIDHFSTYIITSTGILGAENKANRFQTENLSSFAAKKINPDTLTYLNEVE